MIAPPDPFGQYRAIVIEDDPAWQEILAEILADMGLAVDVAASPDAAIAGLQSSAHRLAIGTFRVGWFAVTPNRKSEIRNRKSPRSLTCRPQNPLLAYAR